MTDVLSNGNNPTNASAKYSIDNGTLFPFTVVAQNSTAQQLNLVAFKTPILPPGSHRLFVEYGDDNLIGNVPLLLDYFVIENRTNPPFTLTPSNTTSTTRLSKGAIAGAVIGSLMGLALIIFSLIWAIRFIKMKKKRPQPPWGRSPNRTNLTVMVLKIASL